MDAASLPDPLRVSNLAELPFRRAAEAWLESRKPYISPKTRHEYTLNIKTLAKYFAELKLPEITADEIRAYQRMRMLTVGASTINHECSVIQQMLKRIGRWPEIASDYQPLPLPKEKRGRVLSDEEFDRLFRTAQSSPNWYATFLFAVISVNTTAGPKEVATLRLKDVDLEQIRVQPEGAKNAYRVRTIPLNEAAKKAVQAALERAGAVGSTDPEHYLFPFRIKVNCYDPTRHQTTFRTAWREMRTVADLPGFRMYDLRHHAITALLENPDVSEETVEAIAGHISKQMKKRYSHIRMAMRQQAVKALIHQAQITARGPAPRNDKALRNQDVLDLLAAVSDPKIVVEKIRISATEFDTSVEAIKSLKAASVPDQVILAMVRA